MGNLEGIVNVLVERSKEFERKNSIDMSMFPADQISEIYLKAGEETFLRGDFKSAAHYLFFGQNWDKILEFGVSYFHGDSNEEKEVGKDFLRILTAHDKLPKHIAIELAEDMISEEHSDYWGAARALNAGGAVIRAEEMAYQLLNEGMIEEGTLFLAVAGKKLSDEDREKYSGIALDKGRFEDAFNFYEGQDLMMPMDKAKSIINGRKNDWLFDKVVKYMDDTKHSFVPRDFREFGDEFFEQGEYYKALGLYKRAGKMIRAKEYRAKGGQILSESTKIESARDSYSPGSIMSSVKIAFDYLSQHSVKEAKKRIAQYANNLLEEKDFAKVGSNVSQFGKLYEMIKTRIPADKALRAASIAEEKEGYDEAANYYVFAGMKDDAKRMGNMALRSDNSWQRKYGARECFKVAGDKEGIALVGFLDKNTRDY